MTVRSDGGGDLRKVLTGAAVAVALATVPAAGQASVLREAATAAQTAMKATATECETQGDSSWTSERCESTYGPVVSECDSSGTWHEQTSECTIGTEGAEIRCAGRNVDAYGWDDDSHGCSAAAAGAAAGCAEERKSTLPDPSGPPRDETSVRCSAEPVLDEDAVVVLPGDPFDLG